MSPQSRRLSANGIEHHVLEWEGPPERTVLALHGYLDQATSFTRVGDLLAQSGFRVIAPDFRGHGETDWVPPGAYYHFPDYIADTHAVIQKLIPNGNISIVAHSMGGTVATLLAGTTPERFSHMVLVEGIGPPASNPDVAPERMKRWLDGLSRSREPRKMRDLPEAIERLSAAHSSSVSPEILARAAEQLSKPHPSGEGRAWRFDPLHQTTSPNRFDDAVFEAFARKVTASVLLIDAGASGWTFPGTEVRTTWYPRLRAERIEGAGHMIHWTQPDALVAKISPFLRET